MTVDITGLKSRATLIAQPTGAQILVVDLLSGLDELAAELAVAQDKIAAGADDAQQILDLQKKIDDLTIGLEAAQTALTVDQHQIVDLMAADAATIAALTKANGDLTTAHQADQAANALLTQQLSDAQAKLLSANNALSAAQDQLTAANKTLTTNAATILGLQAQIATLQQQLAALQNPTPPPVNHNPEWSALPAFNFTRGVAAAISFAGSVMDLDGDSLTFAMIGASLPAEFKLDSLGKRIVYDGSGAGALSVPGCVLNANDGKP